MKKNITLEKSYNFALRIIRLCKYLNVRKDEYIISKQVLYTGTNIAAFVEEAQQANDRDDFAKSLSSANKNAFKTHFWLRLLKDGDYLGDEMFDSIIADCEELQKILVSSLKTTRATIN